MNLVSTSRRFAAIVGTVTMMAVIQPALAQEIADTHLAAARQALTAMEATEEFDNILPRAAQGIKNELIGQNPNLQQVIGDVVDETTLSMASRRADLEREAAMAYARIFSEEDLKTITAFYQSDAGQKLLESGSIVAREIYRAADIWQRGITRDLAQQVAQELQNRVGEQVQGAPTDVVPGEPAAPVEGTEGQ